MTSTWTQLSPTTSPSARAYSSAAFDPATGQTILFGGCGSGVYYNHTWSWDGSTWSQLSPTTSPSARAYASMAFSPVTGQMILFGGQDSSGLFDETWSWDGST